MVVAAAVVADETKCAKLWANSNAAHCVLAVHAAREWRSESKRWRLRYQKDVDNKPMVKDDVVEDECHRVRGSRIIPRTSNLKCRKVESKRI